MGTKASLPNIPTQSQYFSLITTHLLQLQASHLSNTINLKIALEKRSFKSLSTIRQNIIPAINPKPIYWKDYLLSYFVSQVKNNLYWYEEVINDINSTVFLDEALYLSPMLFNEFESTTKPTCIEDDDDLLSPLISTHNNNNNYALMDNPNFEKEIFVKLRSNSTRYSKRSYLDTNTFYDKTNNNMQSTNMARQYSCAINPVSSDDSSSECSVPSSSSSALPKKARTPLYSNVKDVISLFKRDLQDNEHPIMKVISIFENQLTYVVDTQLTTLDEETKKGNDMLNTYKELYNEIVMHVREFVITAQSALKLFYAPVVDLNCFNEEKDESINVIMSCLFNTGSLYEKVFELLEIIKKNEVIEFNKKLKEFKDISLKGFGIPERFRLNAETEELMYQMKNTSNNDTNNDTQQSKADNMDDNIINDTHNKLNEDKLNIIKDYDDDDTHRSYESVISILNNIKTNPKPFEKLLLLASMGSEIPECVNEFWKQMETHIPQHFLSINSDDLLSIIIYVIVKSQFPEIIIHNEIINSFTTDNTKSSMVGYYFITVQTAIEYINNYNI